ncbi:MAG: endonuclease/exonuclease/phosphatase family protein [Clostridia bacterium]|nr:endonuclease/exonuclease/phosphatase family protein [Clostridia bacterium]
MKKIIVLIMSLLLLGLVFVSCGETVDPPTPVEDIQLFKDGVSDYVIICADDVSDELRTEVERLNNAIAGKTGKSLELKDDFISEEYGIKESPYEIVIGDCNRSVIEELKPSLRTDDYMIKVVGTKIVILGGSEASTINAAATFKRKCIQSNETAGLVIAGDYVFNYNGEYKVNELKLNGNKITDYTIIYENNNYLPAVNRLNDKLKDVAGVTLVIKNAVKGAGDAHKIMFGDCKNGISDGVKTDSGNYKLISDGNDVCIVAYSTMQADEAVVDIADKYFPAETSETYNIEIKSGTDEKISLGLGETVKVMTQNLWENGYADNLSQQIISRNEYLVEIFDQKRPDIICFQEASRDRGNPNNKGKSIYDYVYGDLVPRYSVVCEKRNDDNRGSFTPIFYRDDLYSVVASGCYRFNDRYDSSDNKSLSWVVFESKIDGKRFGIINCHFALFLAKYNGTFGYENEVDGVKGEEWRQGNVQQLIERYLAMREEYGEDLPIIMTGDFNANPNKTSYKMIAEYEDFADSRLVSTGASTQNMCSHHDWSALPKSGTNMLLDHMFVTKDVITVLSHEIVINNKSIRASDHCAVVCEFQFK